MTPFEYRTAMASAMLRDAILVAKGYPRPIPLPAPRAQPALTVVPHTPRRYPLRSCGEIAAIQALVSDFYGITRAEIVGPSKVREHARPRQMAIYLAKQLTKHSVAEIARYFGGRDHTTAIYAIRETETRMKADADLRDDYEALVDMLCAMKVAA